MNWRCLLVAILICPSALLCAAFDHNYTQYGKLLSCYSRDGLVGYRALQCNRAPLCDVLSEFSSTAWCEFHGWSTQEQIAFLINAYNVAAIQMGVCTYPSWSIRQAGTPFCSYLDQPAICLFGRQFSLNQIDQLLSCRYKDARYHFALTAATLGAPALREDPYRGEVLDAQLDDQVKRFMSQRAKNYLENCVCAVYISPIFFWYECEFIRQYGSLWTFVRPYFREEWGREVYPPCWSLKSSRYDWGLNDWCSCLGKAYAEEGVEYEREQAGIELTTVEY